MVTCQCVFLFFFAKKPKNINMNDLSITKRFKQAIKNSKISQRQLAIKLGLHPVSIGHVVSGRNFLKFDLMVKACEILGVSMDWLAWGKEEKEDNILARLDQVNNTGRARIEYILAIIDEMDAASREEIYEFTIIEMDKKIRTVINRKKKTAEITEEAL